LGIAHLRARLSAHRKIALDTSLFIYQWEAHPRYSPLTDFVFTSIERSDLVAVTSTITMSELLVHPYRDDDMARVNELFAKFSAYPNLEWVAPGLEIAASAAKIRAAHRLRTPDALQAATAIEVRATAMLSNDPIFRRVSDFDTLVLDEYL
jgi:predicted nucleic acid-binding protein